MTALAEVDFTIAWKSDPRAKDMARMWQNNLKQRLKKNSNVDEKMVLTDTAVGYGAELATTASGVLKSVNDVVDDPDQLKFSERMRDFVWNDIYFQGKTSRITQPYWYIAPATMKSLEQSVRFNTYLIVTGYSELAKFHYHYNTRMIIDFKKFMENPGLYLLRKAAYSYPFNAQKAVEDGVCHQF